MDLPSLKQSTVYYRGPIYHKFMFVLLTAEYRPVNSSKHNYKSHRFNINTDKSYSALGTKGQTAEAQKG